MNLDLEGRLFVITGGSGLLGSLFVKTVRNAGGRCINADIICEKNLSADEYHLDITDESSVIALIDAITDEGSSIYGWVNNAYPRTKDWGAKFEDIPYASWQRNVDMHLNGYFLCCQKVLEHMKINEEGSLVNIGSIYGVLGPDFSVYEGTPMTMPAGYAAIKGGITNLGRYLASYYGPYNIRVNTLSPGGIFDSQPESFVKAYEARVPLRRMGTPEDIAPVLLFLLSDASSYISGQNLMVDGGWSAV
jgi:NAD(P)-dependent dehydrogenase (short-subunit alcohol dehydrogenase family)